MGGEGVWGMKRKALERDGSGKGEKRGGIRSFGELRREVLLG